MPLRHALRCLLQDSVHMGQGPSKSQLHGPSPLLPHFPSRLAQLSLSPPSRNSHVGFLHIVVHFQPPLNCNTNNLNVKTSRLLLVVIVKQILIPLQRCFEAPVQWLREISHLNVIMLSSDYFVLSLCLGFHSLFQVRLRTPSPSGPGK